ncbi:MAG: hypothetical protein LQ350_000117 [Teloschistes chrysophthalmus]|nr:MAG: hypothetical protein LQ350_000117 [Niorma chrysophthalma]
MAMETSIDPQLRDHDHPQPASQPYPSLPPSGYPINPIRLPPPQQPHHTWPAQPENHLYYAQRASQHASNLPQPETPSHHDPTQQEQQQQQDQPSTDPKRPRACEACRGLKVRCEPDPQGGTCRRCAKAGRHCIVTAPSRKRQKKTDSRVAELEKKIDALTASLHATKAQAVSESDDDSADDRKPLPHISAPNFRPSGYGPQDEQRVHEPANIARQRPSEPYGEQNERLTHQPPLITERKRRMSQYPEEESGHHQGPFNLASPLDHSAQAALGTSHIRPALPNGTSNLMPPTTPHSTSPAHEYADVVDRKILDAALASALFEDYTRRMAHHLPLVVFPPDTPAGTIRKHRPTLFLAILSVASGQDHPDIQRILAKEIMRTFADKIVYRGEKSLELIQALQVVTIWSWPEENRELQTYQLIHMAAVMAIDLGLGKRIKSDREPSQSLWREYSRTKATAQAIEGPDSWRAWLGCYLLCASASMGLRRPNLIRWTSQMDDCLESLKTSPDNLPSDSVLVDLIRLQRLADDVGNQISLDDSSHTGISDIKTQYALKGFERQMRDWEQQASKQANSTPLTFNFHVANLYMHELAMHLDQSLEQAPRSSNPQGKKAETRRAKPEVLTSAHVGALTTCLTSIHGMFDTFLRSTTEDIRTVPVCFFVRVAHAALLLIKMHFAASTPESELGKVISSDDMRVEDYLRRIREILQAGAASDKCRPARLFFLWIGLLQTWFERQRSGKGSLSEDAGTGRRVEAQPVDVEKQAAKGEYKRMQLNDDAPPARRSSMASGAPTAGVEGMDQSRLHMLGEVALGNSSSNGHGLKHGEDHWPQAYGGSGVGAPGNAYVGYEYGARMGSVGSGGYSTDLHLYPPGFEQAIGMTFNEGNLSYMDDYALYNMMQQPNVFENMA